MNSQSQKGIASFLAIIIVIVVGVLAIGGVLAYQYWWAPEEETKPPENTIDEVASWKTYRNEEHGFEAKYPNDFNPNITDNKPGLFIIRFGNQQKIAYYSVHITENTEFPKLSNFKSNPECYEKIKTERQNNINWVVNRWKCGIGAEQNPIVAYVINKSYIFEILLDSNSETSSVAKISQILSTFKFIETVETADWEIYKNENYGLQFNYPTNGQLVEKQWGPRPDLGGLTYYTIDVNIPFITQYEMWTNKSFDVVIYNKSEGKSCADTVSGLFRNTKHQVTINGRIYMSDDPDWTETSGMSSISKQRNYVTETATRCYTFTERISGPGTNNREIQNPSAPTNLDEFFNTELKVLDEIMYTVKISE